MPHDIEPPVFGGGRYDESVFGGLEEIGEGRGHPWRINYTRVEGLIAPPPPPVPGESATYDVKLLPESHVTDLQERFRTLRRYFRNGPFVETFQLQGGEAHYREQHGAPDGSQLVYIAPLEPDHDAHGTPEDPPPERDSQFQSRYAVVTGGSQSETMLPEAAVTLSIETTTIAPGDEFATREAVRDAREHNGF